MKDALKFLEKNIPSNSNIVVAVSGGPDSMVLFSLLIKLKEKLNLNIIVAHVNHKHRLASEDEAVMVKNYTENNNCTFEYMEIKEYTDDNFHEFARIKRYEFFDDCLQKYKTNILLTAHHGDDLMETILMRLVRGSNLKGYAGFSSIIEKENYKILRPLITYTKDEITKYADENNIPYAVDESNNENIYTRNRFRHYVLPFLKKEDQNVHLKFYKFSKLLLSYSDYIDKQVKEKMLNMYKEGILDVLKLKKEEEIIQMKIIELILEDYYGDDLMLISDVHTKAIYDLIMNKKTNVQIDLPNNKIAIKEYNYFKITEEINTENYNFEFSEYLLLPNGHELKVIEKSENTSNNVIRLNSAEIKLPLYVRSRKPGDKMLVKGLNGSKKVKDIFIDEKVNLSARDSFPVVVDSTEQILWLPGLKKSKFDKQNTENYDIIIKYL